MTEYSSGFYKLDEKLLYAPNFVLNKDYELRRESKDDNKYPIDGWYWFENLQEACTFFKLNIDDYLNPPPPPSPPQPTKKPKR